MDEKVIARFWSKVEKTDGCWIWNAGIFRSGLGYGAFKYESRRVVAHRFAWLLSYGPVPPGMLVCHRCDNPLCVRPDHLFLGTHTDNMRDRNAKCRQARGEKGGNVTLTEQNVRDIRSWHAADIGPTEIARRLGVSRNTVKHVTLRHHWRHLL